MNRVKRALMRATAGDCGRYSAHCSHSIVDSVVAMGRPNAMKHDEVNEGTLFCAVSLHRFGLPYDFAKLEGTALPEACYCCLTPLWDPGLSSSRAERIFIWQKHMRLCGDDGRRLQAHEMMKMTSKVLVLSNPRP
jgi:hypothetical protein